MFAPDVDARFKKIEDNLLVMSELQRRSEVRTEDRFDRLEAIQDAMARWMDQMAEQMANHQAETQFKMNALVDAQLEMREALAELSRTVDRFLKAQSNGGPN